MRVVFFDHCAQMSGAEIALLNTLPALEDITSLVLLGESGPLVPQMEAAGIAVSVIEIPAQIRQYDRRSVRFSFKAAHQALRVVSYSIRIAHRIRLFNPDVVVSNSMKGHVILSVASAWFRAPLLFHVRDRVSIDFMSPGGVALERLLMKIVPRGIVANSMSTMDTVPTSRRQRVRNIVASPIMEPSSFTKKNQNVASSHVSFGIVGRLTEWKGQELAIRSFAAAFPEGDETLEIVGGPLFGEEKYEAFLKELTVELGISSRVTFCGHIDDVSEKIQNWDVMVHSSIIPEPFGQVVVQGMAAGLAVIASGEGGPLETIAHEETGHLFEPRNQKDLVSAMRELAGNNEYRKRLGQKARQAATHYFPSVIGVQMKQTIEATSGLHIIKTT